MGVLMRLEAEKNCCYIVTRLRSYKIMGRVLKQRSKVIKTESDVEYKPKIGQVEVRQGKVPKPGDKGAKDKARTKALPDDKSFVNGKSTLNSERVKRGPRKNTAGSDEGWRKLDPKSHGISKRTGSKGFNWDVVHQALRKLAPVKESVNKSMQSFLPQAIESIYKNLPRAVNFLLPLAIKTVVPGPFAGVAYQVANESVVPYLRDTLLPNAVDHVLSEEQRLEIAIENSLKDSGRGK